MRCFSLKQSHSSRLQPLDCRLRLEYKETVLCHSHALASRDLFIIGSSSYSSAADPSTGHSPLSNPQCPLIPIASSSCTNRVTALRKEARIAGELTSYLPHLDHRETARFSYTSSPYYQRLRQQILSSYGHINRLSSLLLHSNLLPSCFIGWWGHHRHSQCHHHAQTSHPPSPSPTPTMKSSVPYGTKMAPAVASAVSE